MFPTVEDSVHLRAGLSRLVPFLSRTIVCANAALGYSDNLTAGDSHGRGNQIHRWLWEAGAGSILCGIAAGTIAKGLTGPAAALAER